MRGSCVPTGPEIILTLKVLVAGVTVLLAVSLAALAAGRPRLHGRINTVFFALTLGTVAGFETLIHFVDMKAAFDPATREALRVHLCFSIPSAIVLPVMFITGIQKRKKLHHTIAVLFLALWSGTVITGLSLPHG